MARIVVTAFVSPDGVMEAPGESVGTELVDMKRFGSGTVVVTFHRVPASGKA